MVPFEAVVEASLSGVFGPDNEDKPEFLVAAIKPTKGNPVTTIPAWSGQGHLEQPRKSAFRVYVPIADANRMPAYGSTAQFKLQVCVFDRVSGGGRGQDPSRFPETVLIATPVPASSK